MATPNRTSKQIAERFKGNLDYFKKPHYWRRARLWVGLLVFIFGLAAAVAYFWRGPQSFYNAGPVSQGHARFAQDCQVCHTARRSVIVAGKYEAFFEAACLKCHAGHGFHQPNVVRSHPCIACHREHEGPGPMATPVVTHCNACHGSHEVMEASFQLGKSLPPDTFDYRPAKGRVIFKTPRPVRGHTQVFTNFADHPEFLLHTAQLRETIALRFNHQRHFVADIPPVNGKKLQCADCHQPGPNGVYPLKVSYAAHCQTCHALQFDEHNPDLLLPHGPPQAVHAFLHSLETQYADHARRKGITGLREQEDFVTQQMLRLRAQTLSGENLERQVFFNDKRSGPAVSGLAPERATGRAKFPGCAFCHEVTSAGDLPLIAPVTQPDRWLIRARFNHAKHTSASCVECHDALSSRDTADILMPHKAKCAECHSLPGHGPRSGVRDDCSLCHAYHADR